MEQELRLCDLCPGERALLVGLPCGSLRQRLMDIGFLEDTEIECVGISPLGDPAAYLVRGAVFALRQEDSRCIVVRRGEVPWA